MFHRLCNAEPRSCAISILYKSCRMNITLEKTPLNFTEEVQKDLEEFAPIFRNELNDLEWENFTNCFDLVYGIANTTSRAAVDTLQSTAYILYKLNPNDLKYMDRYAMTIMEKDKVEAFKLFRDVCEREPNYDDCYNSIAKCSYGIGLWDVGDQALDKCLEMDETNILCLRTTIYINKVYLL